MLKTSKNIREEARIVKKQNVNKCKETEIFGGTGLRSDGEVHDKTRLPKSKERSKKLWGWRDEKALKFVD